MDLNTILEKIPKATNEDVHSIWTQVMSELSLHLKRNIPASFLEEPKYQSYMFMNAQGELMNNQLHTINKFIPEQMFSKALDERVSQVNFPKVTVGPNNSVVTTHNSIHHLYHIARHIRNIGDITPITDSKSVVEWGGGYGNFARVYLGLVSDDTTYTIVDLPEMSVLQYWYLVGACGEAKVNLVTEPGMTIQPGKVNIVPSTLYEQTNGIHADMFISTWALSESPKSVQVAVAEKNFFGATHFLVGFHQCGNHIPFYDESMHLGAILKQNGCKIEDVKVIPGVNYYAFK